MTEVTQHAAGQGQRLLAPEHKLLTFSVSTALLQAGEDMGLS